MFDMDDIQGVIRDLKKLGVLSAAFIERQQSYIDGTAPGSSSSDRLELLGSSCQCDSPTSSVLAYGCG